MSWLDRDRFPLYHLTSNHNTFRPAGVAVFRQILAHGRGVTRFVGADHLADRA